jgi:hypothetical protein
MGFLRSTRSSTSPAKEPDKVFGGNSSAQWDFVSKNHTQAKHENSFLERNIM